VQNTRLPIASVALRSNALPKADRASLALELAMHIEGRRRSLTLGGGLLCIPAAAAAATGISALMGVPLLYLPLCALLGSALGPALTAMTFAASSAFLRPLAKRKHRKKGRALGLSREDCDEGFARAVLMLEEKSRKRLMRGRQGEKDVQQSDTRAC